MAEEPKNIENKPEENPENTKDIENKSDQENNIDTELPKKQENQEELQKEPVNQKKTEEKAKDAQVKKLPKEKKVKQSKPDVKTPEKDKKKSKHGEDFKYIVRLSNTDIDGEKNLVYGLTGVKGIGMHLANLISEKSGINQHKKIGDLSDSEIEKLQDLINSIAENAPYWMLNHRKDLDTGDDIHLVGSEIDMRLRDEINIMKKIRSYRGIRHERGLRARGQRTKGNNRRGLALGVSKRREK